MSINSQLQQYVSDTDTIIAQLEQEKADLESQVSELKVQVQQTSQTTDTFNVDTQNALATIADAQTRINAVKQRLGLGEEVDTDAT